MFEFSTDNISVAELETVAAPFDADDSNGNAASATVALPKRGRGRPKGSKKQSPPAPAAASTPASAPTTAHASRASATLGELYFDLETVPDYSRLELFGLEPLPTPKEERCRAACTDIPRLLESPIPAIKQYLLDANPVHEYLDLLADAESRGKNRAGVHEQIAAARSAKSVCVEAAEKRRKLLSVTPEYCRVAALGWATGPNKGTYPEVLVAVDPNDERKLLEKFWELAAKHRPLIGFNCLQFDLAVVFARSIILGVPSSCMIDTKPWGGDVVDLMAIRYPKSPAMGLKDLSRLYGIGMPEEDIDGSMVEELLKTDPEKLADYCRNDVRLTRALHSKFCGYFCA